MIASLPCPVCGTGALVARRGGLGGAVCRCGLSLDLGLDGLTLSHVREQLALTFAEHGAGGCGERRPRFGVREDYGARALAASCPACDFLRIVI